MAASDLPRDLNFKDIINPNPKTLTPEQIQEYNIKGYLKPFEIYNELDAAVNRAYFDYILAKVKAADDGRDSYAINGYHSHCRGIYEMATHPKILDLVEDIVGPDIVCWGTHFFCKVPHDPKSVPWHQDASYWPFTPARTVTVWLAIDDTDVENSAMHCIPGTHRMGHLSWKQASEPAVLGQKVENVEKLGTPVPFELKAGQISLHADMIVHGSEPNRSDRRRCGLTMRFCPPQVVSHDPGWMKNAIICRGSDPTGRWTHNPIPTGDEVGKRHRRKAIGAN